MSASTVTFLSFLLTLDTAGGVRIPAPLVSKRGNPGPIGEDDAGEQGSDAVDLLLDTAVSGAPHIPGTSFAGALRDRVRKCGANDDTITAIFGIAEDVDDEDALAIPATAHTARRVASRLWVFDAIAPLPPGDSTVWATGPTTACAATLEGASDVILGPDVRQSTAIDRHRGAARTRTLRSVQAVPAGTVFEVFLQWDGGADDEGFGDLTAALSGWRPRIGSGVSSGQGRCTITDMTVGSLSLGSEADLLTWLSLSGPDLVRSVATEPVELADAAPARSLQLTWSIIAPLIVAGRVTDGNRLGPRWNDGMPSRIVPGTSVKGAIRSRMEYILRSAKLPACGAASDTTPCGACLPCRLFGHGGGDDKTTTSVGARGRVIVEEAIINDDATLHERAHGAIDRFTGGNAQREKKNRNEPTGATKGALHTVQAFERGTLTTTFDLDGLRGDPDMETAFRCLLRLVATDFSDGLAGIGHASHSGYGTIALEEPDPSRRPTDALPSLGDAYQWLAAQRDSAPTATEDVA